MKGAIQKKIKDAHRRNKLGFVHLRRVADSFRQAVEQGARYFHHIAPVARPAVNPPLHNERRTKAMVSENVGLSLAYYAACGVNRLSCGTYGLAINATIEYSARITGVVHAIARSEHCRCVSVPRCARASSKVTSTYQPRMNWARIC